MKDRLLDRSFYERNAVSVAKALLGKTLIRRIGDEMVSGVIVETEAYRGSDDPASHAYRGRTPRNSLMFGRGGFAYIYFVYGRNWCLNATAESTGRPAAVLIRALEPKSGLSSMMSRRGPRSVQALTNGPGRLTQALGITGSLNGTDLTAFGPLYICGKTGKAPIRAVATQRKGVSDGGNLPWRFYLKGNPFVS